jgi:hypothetical protein
VLQQLLILSAPLQRLTPGHIAPIFLVLLEERRLVVAVDRLGLLTTSRGAVAARSGRGFLGLPD